MPNIVYIACSLDGYIAREDGSIDWLTDLPNPDRSDYGFSEFMSRIDAVIMGRKTFETVSGFAEWPYTKPVFVLSRTLRAMPAGLQGKAEPVHGGLTGILDSLHRRGLQNFYIDGGMTIRSFLREDLIDELIITRVPILLGSGIPLFDKTGRETRFEHAQTEVYDNSLVKSRYVRKKS